MGALTMTHSDDEGLVLPPALAPIQVVAVPIYKTETELAAITERMKSLGDALKQRGISFKFDDDDNRRPGWKFAEYESKGVPVRVAMGPRDLENGKAEIARRDTKSKAIVDFENLDVYIENLLDDIQTNLLEKAKSFRAKNMRKVDDYTTFKTEIEKGGFFFCSIVTGKQIGRAPV